MDRQTKIVATVGPASQDETVIQALILAGVNVFRLNFSHGTHEQHTANIGHIREAASTLNRPVTLMQDLQGPKIRTMELAGDSVLLTPGQPLTITTRPIIGNEKTVAVDFPGFYKYLNPGDRILLDDGALELRVLNLVDQDVETEVIVGGFLKPNKGVNLPGSRLDISILTEKDVNDLEFGLKHGVDAIAISFVTSVSDIDLVRDTIARLAPDRRDTPVIAKLERREAVDHLDGIVDMADGVMVARGDLGVELSPQEVPIAQKKIIRIANRHGKVVITATQMLDSMINNPRPTRAEASDVANAIFDGTDAVMLSGETAIGKYPVRSVEIMDAIICQAEANLTEWGHWDGQLGDEASGMVTLGEVTHDDALSITRAARELAHDRNVNAIAVFTQTGRTANLMAKARPRVPILAFTPEIRTYQRLPMLWGVTPCLVPFASDLETMLNHVEKAITENTHLQPGEQIVLISGFPVGKMCPPNLALLYTLRGIK